MQGNRKPKPAEPTAISGTVAISTDAILTVAEVAAFVKGAAFQHLRMDPLPQPSTGTAATQEGWKVSAVSSHRD